MTAPQGLQRPPAEVRFADELAKLGAADSAPRPPGWALNRAAARWRVVLTLGEEAPTPMSATHPAFPADLTALVSGGVK